MAEGSNPKAARQNGRVEAEAVAVPLPKDGAEPDAAIHAQVKEDRAATGDLPSDEASNAKDHSPDDTEHVHKGEKHTHHAPTHSEVPVAGTYLAKVATLGSRWHAVNWAWGCLVTFLVPAVGAIVWFGLIPVDSPTDKHAEKSLKWTFLIHPFTMTFLAYLLVALFNTALDSSWPNRPFLTYFHILVVNYVVQVAFPGLFVYFKTPFRFLALPSLAIVFFVTLVMLRFTPKKWTEKPETFWFTYSVFEKVSVTFFIYMVILAAYMIANVRAADSEQGLLTVALTIIGFIVKKTLLGMTDRIHIETAMLIAGLWIENLTDIFITLAFPTPTEVVTTYAVIWLSRVAENLAYLWFQLDIWFKFRIWIKGYFKKEQAVGIEEDLPEAADDRGHSAHHPAYRRRQLRFLVMKIFSQVSSFVYFLTVVPVLRYGPNKRRFPFSDLIDGTKDHPTTVLLEDTLLEDRLQFLTKKRFFQAMAFTGAQIVSSLLSGWLIWWWMHRFHADIIQSIRRTYNAVVVMRAHYWNVLTILLTNALIGTAFVQIYYRIYFV